MKNRRLLSALLAAIAALAFAATPAGAAITIVSSVKGFLGSTKTQVCTTHSGTTQVVYNATGVNKLVVAVGVESGFNNQNATITNVSFNGVAFTQAVQENTIFDTTPPLPGDWDGGTVAIFYLDNPFQGVSTFTVNATSSGGSPNGGLVSIIGLAGTLAGVGNTNKSWFTQTVAGNVSTSITTSANASLVIAAVENSGRNNGAGTPTAVSPLTLIHNGNWGSQWGSLASGYQFVPTSGTTITPTFNTAAGGNIHVVAAEFRVADATPPTISTLSPADDATDVAPGAHLVATFSENIAIGTGDITVTNLTDATATTIAITDGAQVSVAGSVLTINPTADLAQTKDYAIQIAATAIKDTTGNFFAGITNDTTWNFTVPIDTTPPTLTSIGDDKSGAPVITNTVVTYTVAFNEDMDAGTVTDADFSNAGSAAVTINSVNETTPASGIFTVLVTPTTMGTLQLQINAGAVLDDASTNALLTSSALLDDTTMAVVGPTAYWDLSGATAGAGGATPAGTWDLASPNWNGASDGDGATNAWAAGQTAIFAAGTDAGGVYTITVSGTRDIGGLTFEEGTVLLAGGTALRLVTNSVADVAAGLTATVATVISQDASPRSLFKAGDGTLTLGGRNTFAGNITVNGGTLVAATNASGASTALGSGSNTRTITVNSGATLLFVAPNALAGAFNSTNVPTLVINGGTVNNADPAGTLAVNNALNNVTLTGGTLAATVGQHGGYAAWNINGTITSSGSSFITTTDPTYGTVMLSSVGARVSTVDVQDATLAVSAPLVQDNVDSIISGLTKTGAGTLTLSGTNAYAGATTVSAGTLEIGGAGQLGVGSYAGSITNEAVFAYNSSAAQTLSGTVSGTGTLTKNGSGTLTLSGLNTYAGATTVSSGALRVNGTIGAGAVTVEAGGTLGGTGTVLGATTLQSGALQPGHAGVAGALTLTNLALSGPTIFNVYDGGTGSIVSVTADNGFTLDAAATGTVRLLTALAATGQYTVIDYVGVIQGGTVATNLQLDTAVLPPRASMALVDNAGNTSVDLVANDLGETIVWTGTNSATWDINAATNWKTELTLAETTYLQPGSVGDYVRFDDTAAQFTVTVAAAVSPSALIVSNSLDYTFTGAGIGGGAGLDKDGPGRLQIDTTNTYAGATVVRAGTLSIAGDSGLGAAPGALAARQLVLAGGTLEARGDVLMPATRGVAIGPQDAAGAVTIDTGASTVSISAGVANNTGGTGTLVKAGGGTLALRGTNTYSGTTTVSAGTLFASTALALPGAAAVSNGATLWLGQANVTWSNNLSGEGTVRVTNYNATANNTFLRGDLSAFSGAIVVMGNAGAGKVNFLPSAMPPATATVVVENATTFYMSTGSNLACRVLLLGAGNSEGYGAIRLDGSSIVSGPVTLLGPGITIGANGGTPTITGDIGESGGSYGFTKLRPQNLFLTGTNTYTGPTTISNGTVTIGGDGCLGGGAYAGAITNAGALVYSSTVAQTLSGVISGSGTLTKTGSGLLSLTGANTATGFVTVAGGVLRVAGGGQWFNGVNANKTGALTVNGGAVEFDSWTYGNGTSFGSLWNTAANIVVNGGALRYIGANDNLGGRSFTVGAAGGKLENASTGTTWTIQRTDIASLVSANGGTLTLAGAGSGRLEQSLPGTGGLVMNGPGTWTLASTNNYAYSGGTAVNTGRLVVASTLSNSAVTVASGATLAGTGKVVQVVTSSGQVSPGANGPGQLSVGGYAPSAGAELLIELSGTAPGTGHDVLAVGSGVLLDGALTVTNLAFTPVVGQSFTVLTATALSGLFSATNLPAVGGVVWALTNENNSVVLKALSADPYLIWGAPYGLGAGSETNDNDGDGFVNLLEYSQGSDPTNGASLALMVAGRSNNVLQLKFNRNTNATDISYFVEAGSSVTNNAIWDGINTNVGGAAWSDPANAVEAGVSSPVAVTVYDTASGSTNRYMRLRVTKP